MEGRNFEAVRVGPGRRAQAGCCHVGSRILSENLGNPSRLLGPHEDDHPSREGKPSTKDRLNQKRET